MSEGAVFVGSSSCKLMRRGRFILLSPSFWFSQNEYTGCSPGDGKARNNEEKAVIFDECQQKSRKKCEDSDVNVISKYGKVEEI